MKIVDRVMYNDYKNCEETVKNSKYMSWIKLIVNYVNKNMLNQL